MSTFFIGCLHLGHPNIARYRGFHDVFYHDEHLIESYNRVVNKKDLVYLVGDITMETSEHYYQLDRLNGRKIVVLGNHDMPRHIPELMKYVETVAGMIDYKGFAVTHCPIHPSELSFYDGNIHAHIHHRNSLEEVYVAERYGDTSKVQYPTVHKYFNVDAKVLDYKPISIEEIKEKFGL